MTKEEIVEILYKTMTVFEHCGGCKMVEGHNKAADRILSRLSAEQGADKGDVVLKYCNTWDNDDLDSIYGYVAGKSGALVFRPIKPRAYPLALPDAKGEL